MTADPQGRLDEEIERLRERLDSAEEMRRAIVAAQVDGFVVGEDAERVVLLDDATLAPRTLIEHLPHGIVTVSRQAEILYANRRFAEAVGYPLDRLFSTSMLDVVAPESRPAFRRFLAASEPESSLRVVLAGMRGAIDVRVTTMTVSNDYTSLLIDEKESRDRDDAARTLAALASGNIDGVVVGGERVMLLADAHRPYQALVDRMQEGAATVSAAGDVLYANERFATMVGAPREKILGRRLRAVLGTPAIDAMLMNDDERPTPVEFTLIRADGSLLPVRVALERIDGIEAKTLILEDLSERERHRAIQDRARRNDHFLAVLAHELRNPLGAIRNAAAILGRTLRPGERDALGVIERQSETLVRLVDDLLDVHRLNEGKMVLQRKPVLVKRAIDDAVGAVVQNLTTKGQTVQVRLPDEPLYIDADSVRIAQVLTNLLLNASKFTGKGGHVEVRAERIAHDATPVARISVIDDGIGVAPEQLEHIFEPYVQASTDASHFPEGLGLGLAVARRLVELHGGRIRAQSDGPGCGSTFVVELPLCDVPAGEATTADAQAQQTQAVRILIADDDRDSAATLASLLELLGHETHTANDGDETIASADRLRPDVVILDIRMPQVDGLAAARMLRKRAWARKLVLYALTGWGEARDRGRTREAGFDRHFVKPVTVDDLLAHLAGDLERRRSRSPDASATEAESGD